MGPWPALLGGTQVTGEEKRGSPAPWSWLGRVSWRSLDSLRGTLMGVSGRQAACDSDSNSAEQGCAQRWGQVKETGKRGQGSPPGLEQREAHTPLSDQAEEKEGALGGLRAGAKEEQPGSYSCPGHSQCQDSGRRSRRREGRMPDLSPCTLLSPAAASLWPDPARIESPRGSG